jgi:hypothetical protein
MVKNSGKVLKGDKESQQANAVDRAVMKVTGSKMSDEDRYRADDAMRTIARAEELKGDKKTMGHVKERMSALSKAVKNCS